MTSTKTIWATAAAVVLSLLDSVHVLGDDSSLLMQASSALAAERQQANTDVSDPAFDVYVSPVAIGEAYAISDPVLLTDVALQLVEGERVLLRNRKGITAAQALKLAVKAASNKHNQQSLKRLAKSASQRNDEELATDTAAAQKLLATSRDTTSRLLVPIDEVEVEAFERIRYCVQAIDQATLAGDPRSLVALEHDIETCIPGPLRDGIKKMIADARVTIPELSESNEQLICSMEAFRAKSDTDDALSRLEASSRQGLGRSWWWLVEWWNPSRGEWYIDMKVYFAETQPEDTWKREQTRARNRAKQIGGCGYETRITTVYSDLIPDRRWLRANCPPRPTGTIGTTSDSAPIGKPTKPTSSATLGTVRRGAHIDGAGKVFYNGKYLGKATKTTYQGRACWMFDGGLAAIYRFVNETKTHEKNLLSFPLGYLAPDQGTGEC